MINSMNDRRGAANTTVMNIEINSKKMSYTDFRIMKKDLKEKLIEKNANIVTSDYFQYFDTNNPKNMNDKQSHYLDIAAKIAMKSTMNHKHGCILVCKKQIISSGYNYSVGETSIHAEIAAISNVKGKFKKFLSESEMYVVRIGPNNFHDCLKYSKPCFNCQNYISKKSIKKIYYSTNYDYDVAISEYLENKK